jgi:hypothetical protein
MVKQIGKGLRLDADFTEDVVGFALESFLTVMSFPRQRFSIEPFSRSKERWLGADARLHGEMRGFRPFYMQFKRPSAYPDFSSAKLIKDRKSLKLQASPRTLYFDLREKQSHHWDFQHNILFRLRQRLLSRQLGDAAYVCPLFLERTAYRLHLHWSGLSLWPRFWRHHPWDFEEVLLNNGGNTIHFDRIPVLAEHITVPPHEKIASAKHRYSFTEAGTELCFHSPEALPEGATNLAAFLNAVSGGFLDGGEKIQPQQANEELKLLMSDTMGDQSERLRPAIGIDEDDPIGSWFAWGDYLRMQFGIDQYALVSWRD